MSSAGFERLLVPVDPRAPATGPLALAAQLLGRGRLVAFPTESFYGLGANALDPVAVAGIFRAKGRPADKPLLVLVDSLPMLELVAVEIPGRAHALIERYWPGPLTLILRAKPDVPVALTAGTGTVGVRLPGHPVARALVAAAAFPVTAPSANRHGELAPRTAREVVDGIGDHVELVLDGGRTAGGPASTVLDVTVHPARIVRAGAVPVMPGELMGD